MSKEFKVVELGGFRPAIESTLNSMSTAGWEFKSVYGAFGIWERELASQPKTSIIEDTKPSIPAPMPIAPEVKPTPQLPKPVFPGRKR